MHFVASYGATTYAEDVLPTGITFDGSSFDFASTLAPGEYTINLTATSDYGCGSKTDQIHIVVYGGFSATASRSDEYICLNGDITLTANPVGGRGDGVASNYTYQWYSAANAGAAISGATSQTFTGGINNVAGTYTYYVKVTDKDNYCGTTDFIPVSYTVYKKFDATASCDHDPANYCFGDVVTLTANPRGGKGQGTDDDANIDPDNYTYQWYSAANAGAAISGATSQTYTGASTAGEHTYFVKVTDMDDFCGSTDFIAVTYNVYEDFVLTNNNSDAHYCKDETTVTPLEVSVTTGSTNPASYQWYRKNMGTNVVTKLTGETNATYTPATDVVGRFEYSVIVDNGCDDDSVLVATVDVYEPVEAGAITGNLTLCQEAAGTTTLTADPQDGSTHYDLQWQMHNGTTWVNITGETANTYAASIATVGTTQYRYYVTDHDANPACADTSDAVTVTVLTPVEAGVVSGNLTVCHVLTGTTVLTANPEEGSGDYNYQWQTYNTGTSNWEDIPSEQAVTYNASTATVGQVQYRVVVTDANANPTCEATSDPVTVTVLPDPAITFDDQSTPYCIGATATPLSITSMSEGSGEPSYEWMRIFGTDTVRNIGSNATYTPSTATAGDSVYAVIVNNGCGSDTATIATINVWPGLTADITAPIAGICIGTTTTLEVSNLNGVGGYEYQWQNSTNGTDWTDISGANIETYDAPINEAGHIYYKVNVTDLGRTGTCNSLSRETDVEVWPALAAASDVAHTDTTYCINATPEQLHVTYTGGDGTTPSYQWYADGVAISGANNDTYVPSTANGTSDTMFSVKITGTCNSDSIGIARVKVYEAVTVTPTGTDTTYCVGTTAEQLSVAVSGGNGDYIYQWYGNNVAISGATTPIYTPATTNATSDTVFSIKVTSLCGNDSITVARIQTYPSVAASTTSVDAEYCLNALTVTDLNVSVTQGNTTPTYQWKLDGADISGADGATYTPAVDVAGTFNYSVKVSNGCGSDSIAVATVTVWSQPVANVASITRETVACVNDTTAAVSDTTALATLGFHFSEGHNINPNVTVVSNSYANNNCNGSRTTVYRVTDECGNSVDVTYIQPVKDSIAPVVTAVAEIQQAEPALSNCQYKIPDLTALVREQSQDNCSDNLNLNITQYPEADSLFVQTTDDQTIAVTLTVADECGNPTQTTVNVFIPANDLQLIVGESTYICVGDSATLTAVAGSVNGGVTYVWTPADGLNTTTGNNVHASPSSETVYTVRATDLNGCWVEKEISVRLHPELVLSVDDPANLVQTVCPGGQMTPVTVTYDNATLSVTGLPNGITYNEASHIISGQPFGTNDFMIVATSPYGCGADTLSGTITLGDTIMVVNTQTVCDNYDWDANGQSYTTSGRYRYATRTADDQCDSVMYLNLTVNCSNSGDTTAVECGSFVWYGSTYNASCEATRVTGNQWGCDSTVTLHLTIGDSYSFNDADSMCDGGIYEYHGLSLTREGSFSKTYQSMYGCDSVYTIALTVKPAVTISIEKTADCEISQYILTATTNGNTFEWSSSVDDGQIEAQRTSTIIYVSPAETTTYTFTADRVATHFCRVSESITVDEMLIPNAYIETNDLHISPDFATWTAYDASTGAQGREWYVDGEYYYEQGESIHGTNEIHGINDSISLMLIAIGEFCNDTTTAKIPVVVDPMYVPNIFTPTKETNKYFGGWGDGISDYEIWVYSREGLLVFHSTSMEETWNGKHQGKDVDCKQGAYTYKVQYRIAGQPDFRRKFGTVTLIR